jgi:hypothetical protein
MCGEIRFDLNTKIDAPLCGVNFLFLVDNAKLNKNFFTVMRQARSPMADVLIDYYFNPLRLNHLILNDKIEGYHSPPFYF